MYTRLSCCVLLCWACSNSGSGSVRVDPSDAGTNGGTGGSVAASGNAGTVGGSPVMGGSAGANTGGSAMGGIAGTSGGGSSGAGASSGGSATGGSTGITPECSAVGTAPADHGQCTKDAECLNPSNPAVTGVCDRGLCWPYNPNNPPFGQECVPAEMNMCGSYTCRGLPDSPARCRFCLTDADCSHLTPSTGMKMVCGEGGCEEISAACRDGWPCANDAECASEFCDLGKCVRRAPDDPSYGARCFESDEANLYLCGVYPCRALSDSPARCRSCESDADCQVVGSSSTCQVVAGDGAQSCTQ
jgi:hypothetical protein